MKTVFFLVFFIFVTLSLFSFGRKEKSNEPQNNQVNSVEAVDTPNQPKAVIPPEAGQESTIKILGQIEIYGSFPHTFAGIVDENGTAYAIYPPSVENELRDLQGHLIEFTVIFLDKPQGLGGMFLRGGTVTPLGWEIKQ